MDYTSNYNAAKREGEALGLKRGIEQGIEQGCAESLAEIDRLKALLAEHNIPVN